MMQWYKTQVQQQKNMCTDIKEPGEQPKINMTGVQLEKSWWQKYLT